MINNGEKEIEYIYDGYKINIISYEIIIEKEPIKFFDEKNNSFKVYNSHYLNSCLSFLKKNMNFMIKKIK